MSGVEWLEQAGVVMICTSLDFPELPLRAPRDRSAYKLYMADTGLLIAQLDKEAQEDVRVRRNLGTWKGGLFENIVAEALVKAGAELSYYKKDNSTLDMKMTYGHGDLFWKPRMVGRTLLVRRNRNKTRFSLKYDCGAAGVRSLPRKSTKRLILLVQIVLNKG